MDFGYRLVVVFLCFGCGPVIFIFSVWHVIFTQMSDRGKTVYLSKKGERKSMRRHYRSSFIFEVVIEDRGWEME